MTQFSTPRTTYDAIRGRQNWQEMPLIAEREKYIDAQNAPKMEKWLY